MTAANAPGLDASGGNARLLVLATLFLGVLLVLGFRLYQVQLLEHDKFSALATAEHRGTIPIVPRRGAILDTEGHPLAISVLYDSVFVVGSQVKDPQLVAQRLAPILEMPPEEIAAQIDPKSTIPVLVKARLPAAIAARVRALGLNGVFLEQAPSREYPEGSIAAQVLGFVGRDFHGLAGLELSLDDVLAGKQGAIESEWDTTGREISIARRVVSPAVEGTDVVLTLDRYVQRTAERILANAVLENKATGGVILVMNPRTGALLAMAHVPTYSLTDDEIYKPGHDDLYKPVWVTDQYEPGSVMKVITMAAGINEGVVTPRTTIEDKGYVVIDGVTIHNWDGRANGVIDMTQVLVHSANVGSQFVSGRLGKERFYHYLELFGFGQPTNVGLPGETPGLVRDYTAEGWTRLDLATNSYGQGVAVTPLQMLSAVAVLGNDGTLMKPMLVQETRGPGGQVFQPQAVRQVVSPETARTLRTMMVAVMNQPALEQDRVPGYVIAGKTGTADFATTSGYNTGKTYASVVALLPADEPRLAILVRLDAPEKIYGGIVAAPVLKQLVEELVTYYRIPPSADVHASAQTG